MRRSRRLGWLGALVLLGLGLGLFVRSGEDPGPRTAPETPHPLPRVAPRASSEEPPARVSAPPVTPVSRASGPVLRGRTVVEGTEEPLPLVALVLSRQEPGAAPWDAALAPKTARVDATSDARGDFQVEGLPPGLYRVEAQSPGYVRGVLDAVGVPRREPLRVALAVACVIEGFVVDARGQPAAGAEVYVTGSPAQWVSTGAGGGFSVEVEPGVHVLSARRGEEAGALERPLVSVRGHTTRDVRIQLGAGAVLEGQVVVARSGAPVKDAWIEVTPHGTEGASHQARSDAEGRFSVGGLAPGAQDVRAHAPGFAGASRRGLVVRAGERFPLRLELAAQGAVEGVVRDARGRPLPGALVTGVSFLEAEALPETRTSQADASGHYRLDGLAVGPRLVTARPEGSSWRGASQSVDVREDGVARADFTLAATGAIEGRVRASRGALPSKALEVTSSSQGEGAHAAELGWATVSPSGDFHLELPAGTHELLLVQDGRAAGTPTPVLVEAGRTARSELVWDAARAEAREANTLRGTVFEPDGTPSPGARVIVAPRDTPEIPWSVVLTDDSGRFAVDLTSSPRPLSVSARQGGRVSGRSLLAADARELGVRLRPSASLRGRVLGEGVRGFTLTLQERVDFGAPGEGRWEFSGDRFELSDVPAQPLHLGVRTSEGRRGTVRISPAEGARVEVDIPLSAVPPR